ncbi:MAG: hypothetical protein U9Q07_08755 [Planctomycetota bacterium]|nr:hypothetical protein [Planctomycetota bacterium]
MTKRTTWLIATIVCLLVALSATTRGAEPNPKNYIATASGDNTLLAADAAGRSYLIHAIAVIATSGTAVSFYVHNDDNDMLGDSTNKLTIDLDGSDGPGGFVLPYNHGGWMETDVGGEAVSINLSAATPVIVLVMYSLR